MNKFTKAKTIGMILLAALLLAVPAGMVLAEIPNNPSNAADRVERPEPAGPPVASPPVTFDSERNIVDEAQFEIGEPLPVAPSPVTIDSEGNIVGESQAGPALEREVGIATTSHLPQRSLSAGVSHQWGPYFFTAGEIVVISIAWTPRFSDTDLGVVCRRTGRFISVTRTLGAGTVVVTIPESGFYYVRIHNRGPHLIWYCGYKTI